MKMTDKLISLSVLSALVLIAAPLASAQETTTTDRSAIRAAFEACVDDGNTRRDCREKMSEQFPEIGERFKKRRSVRGHVMRSIDEGQREDAKADFQVCRDMDGDRDAKRECMREVMTKYDAQKPRQFRRQYHMTKLTDDQKATMQEAREKCKQLDDRTEVRSCMKEALDAAGIEQPMRKHRRAHRILSNVDEADRESVRTELKSLKEAGDREAVKAYVGSLSEKYNFELPEFKHRSEDRPSWFNQN